MKTFLEFCKKHLTEQEYEYKLRGREVRQEPSGVVTPEPTYEQKRRAAHEKGRGKRHKGFRRARQRTRSL